MKKIDKDKELLIEQLKKTPIIQIACEKIGIGRATFYRWKASDPEFSAHIEEAIGDGRLLINDLAEANLIGAIKDRNISAIQYWLKTHHVNYKTKMEISGKVEIHNGALNPEQEALVRKALTLAGLISENETYADNKS
ncbi:MAG: phBC6A51 family helix-turn-helix protein [Patescibacteria group bacterium]|nr:phBC6A51 family helix-turn-helix protein [Patescibacteria group bacterium]MDD4610469.1 phBC6A51 family helix-turn-helix protein [Patescibacteria group bacterium]